VNDTVNALFVRRFSTTAPSAGRSERALHRIMMQRRVPIVRCKGEFNSN
jgi:hypothetical protein